jgi:hypothetical protein
MHALHHRGAGHELSNVPRMPIVSTHTMSMSDADTGLYDSVKGDEFKERQSSSSSIRV